MNVILMIFQKEFVNNSHLNQCHQAEEVLEYGTRWRVLKNESP